MIITTARRPSSKTRIFCKHLSRFMGWEYVTRGKMSLSELADEPFLLIGEYKGNPGNLGFFLNGKCFFSIRANVSLDKDIMQGQEPVIEGDTPLAAAMSKATGFRMGESSERVIKVNDRIEFLDKRIPYIRLTVLGTRGGGIV